MAREATIHEFKERYEVICWQRMVRYNIKTFFPLDEFGLELSRDWAKTLGKRSRL